MSNAIMQFFDYRHIPNSELAMVSAEVCALAERMEAILPNGPEKSAGLRKLLEAKDCFVRAKLQKPQAENSSVPPAPVPPAPVVIGS